MDYLSPFSYHDPLGCQVLKGCAAGPAFGGSGWVQVGVFSAGQGDIQDGQATADNVQGCGVGRAVLCLAVALIRGWASGISGS